MAWLGLVCGMLYSVIGLVLDLGGGGLNSGTALAFLSILGMPILFGSFGFLCGALGALALRLDDPEGLADDPLGPGQVAEEGTYDAEADDVGEVILLLSVVRLQAVDPFRELAGRAGHQPGVDLANRTLGGSGIFLLDDPLKLALLITDNASQTGGIVLNQSAQHARGPVVDA